MGDDPISKNGIPGLAGWAPDVLREFYSNVTAGDLKELGSIFPELVGALYRLGTVPEMESVWEKLITKFGELHPRMDKNWVVHQFIDVLSKLLMQPTNTKTPQFKRKEMLGLTKSINKLISQIENSSEASLASHLTVRTYLGAENILYREHLGEPVKDVLGRPVVAEDVSVESLRIVSNPKNDISKIKLDDSGSWSERGPAGRCIWWLETALNADLESLLKTYLKQLDYVSFAYEAQYVISVRANLTKELYEIMQTNYGQPFNESVLSIVNAALNLQLGLEDIKPYKPKEKNS